MNIGKKIKQLRLRQGYTTLSLATAAGVAQGTIIQIEHGSNPNLLTLLSILEVLKSELIVRDAR
jgi:transcriptional regulator with XRE-family HTH domain